MEHREVKTWSGEYMGVPYEIRQWSFSDGRPVWNYYLFLNELQLPDAFPKLWLRGKKLKLGGRMTKHVYYEYDKTIIGNLEWHCGCTYYDKVSGHDGAVKIVKAGCDYAHLWDENRHYDLMEIEHGMMECVESLHNATTVLKRCLYCGEYVTELNEKNYCEGCKDK